MLELLSVFMPTDETLVDAADPADVAIADLHAKLLAALKDRLTSLRAQVAAEQAQIAATVGVIDRLTDELFAVKQGN